MAGLPRRGFALEERHRPRRGDRTTGAAGSPGPAPHTNRRTTRCPTTTDSCRARLRMGLDHRPGGAEIDRRMPGHVRVRDAWLGRRLGRLRIVFPREFARRVRTTRGSRGGDRSSRPPHGPSPAPITTCVFPGGKCTKSHALRWRSSPLTSNLHSPNSTRKSSCALSRLIAASWLPGLENRKSRFRCRRSGPPSRSRSAARSPDSRPNGHL